MVGKVNVVRMEVVGDEVTSDVHVLFLCSMAFLSMADCFGFCRRFQFSGFCSMFAMSPA